MLLIRGPHPQVYEHFWGLLPDLPAVDILTFIRWGSSGAASGYQYCVGLLLLVVTSGNAGDGVMFVYANDMRPRAPPSDLQPH